MALWRARPAVAMMPVVPDTMMPVVDSEQPRPDDSGRVQLVRPDVALVPAVPSMAGQTTFWPIKAFRVVQRPKFVDPMTSPSDPPCLWSQSDLILTCIPSYSSIYVTGQPGQKPG